ncbi:MAG: endopeptidase La [Candidatus Delongbacteria bacterium]|nr:endopeptidase La [Candidatus Delongbacteria bacterium]MDD4204623.1 endopeptidase La [Candidatus Delongbacteria bacterium]MDY0017194.1 endopeptidase La [Candidatus Delongbacteria bacterium]
MPAQSNNQNRKSFPIPDRLPILPLMNMVVFPNVIMPLIVNDESLIKLINDSLSSTKIVGIFANKPDDTGSSKKSEIYNIGTAVLILRMFRGDRDNSARLLVQGLGRIELKKIEKETPYIIGKVEHLKEKKTQSLKLTALLRSVTETFTEIINLSHNIPDELRIALNTIKAPSKVADFIASNLNLTIDKRQKILEETDIEERLILLSSYLNKELKLLKLTTKIQEDVDEELEKDQKDYYLREQLRAIKKELGETEDESQELEELQKKLSKKKLPDQAQTAAKRELKRLNRMSSASSEYTVARTYLDWLLDLPWNEEESGEIDIEKARKILDEDHYGLKEIKERILEYMAVRKLTENAKGSILCLVGPPGTGKTSIGKSIARAMGRKFARASLGGVRDEAEIRGHRRTYIGSMPGIIIKQLRHAGVRNPVMMLDEIDKLTSSNQGDPAAALLEALDPEQNSAFVDHYLDVPFDLSKIMFIMTANYPEYIPEPLYDRMEIIEFPSYIIQEKVAIAEGYIIKRQMKQNGLVARDIKFTRKAVEHIVQNFTREAGVRKLEQRIEKICRKVAVMKAKGEKTGVKVDEKKVREYLGNKFITPEMANRKDEVGVCTGLAWSPAGGSILFIEANLMKGTGRVKITGQLGEVMKESAEIAISYMRANADYLGIDLKKYDKSDLHIHVPDGATPKDGPSAGLAITTAIISLYTKNPVSRDVAMTGEISLRGKAMEIGGLREKIIAAQKARIKTVIIPRDNLKDLEEIPKEVLDNLDIKSVKHIDEVLKIALKKKIGGRKKV